MADNIHSRRQLLKRSLRYTAAGTVAVTAGAITVKRNRLVKDGKCINKSVCKNCRIFSDCGLPRALSVKQAISGESNG